MFGLLFAHVRRRVVLLVLLSVLASLVPSVARAETPLCQENETAEPAPENQTGLIELQSNAARATFDVKLDDHTSGSDTITFNPQAGKRPGRDAVIAAEITDSLRLNGQPLGGTLHVGAGPNGSGRRVVLEACLENVPQFTAGRYQGTVSIYGPKLADFNYAIVVTTKWPPWIALLCILVTLVAFVGITIVGGQWKLKLPRGKTPLHKVGYVFTTLVTLVIVVALAGATYWSVYSSNQTWGENPAGDVLGLIGTSFAAAAAGFATANKLLPTTPAAK
jgi:hypothetical protein